jgi:hypothetical protein
LRPDIRALPVFGRRVVHAVEEFEQRAVAHERRVECNLESFGVCTAPNGEEKLAWS